MTLLRFVTVSIGCVMFLLTGRPTYADDLFQSSGWANMASDRKASNIGDVLSVVVFQNTEARNTTRNSTQRKSGFDADLQAGSTNEFARASIGSNFSGRGDIQRSDSLITQISVVIYEVLPNGDYLISGKQNMRVNGESTIVGVRGRIRAADITSNNQILSTRIADAQINYSGTGFVSRGARPGIISKIFNFLRLG